MPNGRKYTASEAYERGKEVIAVGTPYSNDVIQIGVGMDCSGFIWYIFGFPTPRLTTAQMIDTSRMENADFIRLPYTGVGSLQKGDVLCYKDSPMGHTTFYIGNGRIMHETDGHAQYGSAPGGAMTTVFRPREGWDEVPILWTPS